MVQGGTDSSLDHLSYSVYSIDRACLSFPLIRLSFLKDQKHNTYPTTLLYILHSPSQTHPRANTPKPLKSSQPFCSAHRSVSHIVPRPKLCALGLFKLLRHPRIWQETSNRNPFGSNGVLKGTCVPAFSARSATSDNSCRKHPGEPWEVGCQNDSSQTCRVWLV
ncbi:hypothetical protein DL95DRAFT_387634 [Leptodontidium sp. 2 PMI_412]|nr:hypothetical protein DL95DRAFT_387634 [Leptodontidium sp. 2 PMI_412]